MKTPKDHRQEPTRRARSDDILHQPREPFHEELEHLLQFARLVEAEAAAQRDEDGRHHADDEKPHHDMVRNLDLTQALAESHALDTPMPDSVDGLVEV